MTPVNYQLTVYGTAAYPCRHNDVTVSPSIGAQGNECFVGRSLDSAVVVFLLGRFAFLHRRPADEAFAARLCPDGLAPLLISILGTENRPIRGLEHCHRSFVLLTKPRR